ARTGSSAVPTRPDGATSPPDVIPCWCGISADGGRAIHYFVMIAAAPMSLGSRAAGEFQLRDSDAAKGAHGATKSKLVATKTEAAMKFFVVDKENRPMQGIVVCL